MNETNYLKDTYPIWLVEKSFGDWFDWNLGLYSTFERFLEYATLHDSYWCGIQSYLDNSANLIINFDAFWNQELADHTSSKVKEWPYLIVKIERVFNVEFESNETYGGTIGDVKTELISTEQKDSFIESICSQNILNPKIAENIIDNEIYKTKIEDVCSGFVSIIHTKTIRLLLYNAEGELINLPKGLLVKKEE
jgi:hypothetical protein